MQILKANAILVHDTRRAKKNGLYPIKLRVTFNREQQYYPTKVDLTKDDFSRIMNSDKLVNGVSIQSRRELKECKIKTDAVLVKAIHILDKLHEFSFDSFEAAMFSKVIKNKDVYSIYTRVIEKLNLNGNLGTASNYQCSRNSLMHYKARLDFKDVTVDFLRGYEEWLLNEGKSISTVGIYLRPLRAILNLAIEEGYFTKDKYPFTKRRYQIPASKNTKKALTQEEVGRIYHFKAEIGSWWQRAKDMWLFSYFANGMNVKDIALLKHKNVEGDFIRFIRAKTKNTSRTAMNEISIYISNDLRKIIDAWKTNEATGYLFSVITEGQNLNRQRSLITQFTKMVNTYIGRIARELKIEKPVTTYTARHSFATVLKRSGVSTEIISESLGHNSLKTTSSYLASFEENTKIEISKLLVKF
ncbi:MAG: site-specific integrase [Ferruginibacter sp.]